MQPNSKKLVMISGVLLAAFAAVLLLSNVHTAEANVQAAATPVAKQPADAVVLASTLNLRAGPGPMHERIGALSRGTKIAVTGQVNDCAWLKVVTPTGQAGWVSGQSTLVERHFDCAQIPTANDSSSVGDSALGANAASGQTAGSGESDIVVRRFTLENPVGEPSYGMTPFVWRWEGDMPSGYGFEIVVWRKGDPPRGIHDAVRDNTKGRIQSLGSNRYRLDVDIFDVPSVQQRPGEYWWTVRIVQFSPEYVATKVQAQPASFNFRLRDNPKPDEKHTPCPTYGCSTALYEKPSAGQMLSTATWLVGGLLLGAVLMGKKPRSRGRR